MMRQEAIPEETPKQEYLEEIESKLEKLLELKRKSIDLSMDATSGSLDEESMQKMMGDFEEAMRGVLRTEVLEKIVSVRHDAEQFEETVSLTMKQLLERVQSDDAMKEAIQSQMTVMTVSLENSIGKTVNQEMEQLITSKINEKLRSDLKEDMAGQLVEVRDFILNHDADREQKTQSESVTVDEHKLEEVEPFSVLKRVFAQLGE